MDAKDMKEFRLFLKQCTNAQVQGVYDKEISSDKEDKEEYAELAVAEAEARGIILETENRDFSENVPFGRF